ncbi:MAG: Rrf2 family transcriptional regulator [Bacteroidetes bacterium]|nr:Rrf2 family transcriptional regulator [Bacteroidota bacterium]MBS1973649.1 Rrf2 family transcriptional regulator [Bacteroidota bacterium]
MFSKTTEYALRAVIYIAQKGSEEKKLGLAEIAKAIHSPKSFTAKILQQLTSGNKIVSSARGPNGGFYITNKAKKLPIRAILAVMGEDAKLEKCMLGLNECSELRPCPLHSQYKLIKPQLAKLFETKTIQDLADEIKYGTAFIKN